MEIGLPETITFNFIFFSFFLPKNNCQFSVYDSSQTELRGSPDKNSFPPLNGSLESFSYWMEMEMDGDGEQLQYPVVLSLIH